MRAIFPKSSEETLRLTSPADPFYNCAAWAVSSNNQVIWPDPDMTMRWPADLPREESFETFSRFFEMLGFELTLDQSFESGFEKVAVYVDGGGSVCHLARQLQKGWTSKLGQMADVWHESPTVIDSPIYGSARHYFRRKVTGQPPTLPDMRPKKALLISTTGLTLIADE